MDEDNELKKMSIMAVINREGGYVNHPDDRGGETRWGITHSVAKDNGYDKEMKDFPIDMAIDIYGKKYWDRLKLDDISDISESLATILFDYGVNSGIGRVSNDLQRMLNVMNVRGSIYKDIIVDGHIGTITINALSAYYHHRQANGIRIMCKMINALRMAFCFNLAEKKESQEAFIYGWLSRIADIG